MRRYTITRTVILGQKHWQLPFVIPVVTGSPSFGTADAGCVLTVCLFQGARGPQP
jgi:hypothetical protein